MELEKILFVIVLYKQTLENSSAFKSLMPLIASHRGKISIFVYDNSPTAGSVQLPFVTYHHDSSNPGVSFAYNKAFAFAGEKNFSFLLLMDQDSFFPEQTLRSYSLAVAANPTLHVFAPIARDKTKIYSPFRLINGRGISTSLLPGIYSLKKIFVINSGLLVSVHAFRKSGGYDERFPLDFSDIHFCERLAHNDFELCLIDASFQHHHSSSTDDSRERFINYLNALVLFKTLSTQRISYWLAGFPRAAKLSVQFRDGWFLQQFFKLRV